MFSPSPNSCGSHCLPSVSLHPDGTPEGLNPIPKTASLPLQAGPGNPDKNPPTHLWEPLPSSWVAYRPDTCCHISLDTSVRAHTHTHSCTPRIGSSKQEKLGINGASCRRRRQLLCSSLESSWDPAGTSPPPPHPQLQACGRQVLSQSFINPPSHPTALY